MNKDTLISNPVQGYAVYLEFGRKDKKVTEQFLFTPDGFDINNNFVPAYLYFRYLDINTPHRRWRAYLLSGRENVTKFLEIGDSLVSEQAEEFTEERLNRTFTSVISRFGKGTTDHRPNMEVVFSPIVVEVSKKDLSDISKRVTPTKILYRVQQVKKSVGFPETLQVA